MKDNAAAIKDNGLKLKDFNVIRIFVMFI